MNYPPVIAEHVTYNFLVDGIGRLKVFVRLWMRLRNNNHGEKTRDGTVSFAIYDFWAIFKWIIVNYLTSPEMKKIKNSPRKTQSCSTVTSSKFNFRCRKLPPDILVLDSLHSLDILTRQRQTNETQNQQSLNREKRLLRVYCEWKLIERDLIKRKIINFDA